MNRQPIYYAVIALGVICLGFTIWRWVGTAAPDRPSESPDVLLEKISSAPAEDDQFRAARDLVRYGREARPQLRQAVAASQDKPAVVRRQLYLGVMKAGDWQSLPELFRAMEHPDPIVRGGAGAAAQGIMGMDFQFRANDPPETRAAILKDMRKEFEVVRARLQELDREADAPLR